MSYHIHYHVKGERSSALESLTPMSRNGKGEIVGRASNAHVRKLWNSMLNAALRTGYMNHPDTGVQIDLATLHFGGSLDKHNQAHGGTMCEKWDTVTGLTKIYDPEPPDLEIPEQPEPEHILIPAEYSPEETEEAIIDVE